METVDNRTFKQKVHDFTSKAKGKVDTCVYNIKRTVKDHPMETFTIACLAVPGVLRVVNSAIRAHSQNQETRYNECDIYDPRTGTHYYTKRPLSNTQKLNLENEYKAGRNKGEILRDMKML
ncbi:hypothetical protein [Butyrivibrio sp. INlla21]|uniref:hypothetical protein n=1 Tax=Butyrivibrio sp. INlla21 TaxID=1520811 RepID=UPI0008E9574B|nr:hypothetical protein [Butyrivibrio sp. INlla21]SFU31979.1 hypothetical protein SAMN02910342_00057 [Butyrivibrio sp. INlla21]